ncbi:NAD(P)/FAD-dependent oxidoreductase [Microbacterium luticocti]|uniref:NAD(P)/FAD-dependent oxidoreductase n=1 Tax=Microbacterium luticocti TaxID=451764 RepID=UPI00040596C6|nr:FAD-dependent oxidoreductase [Microbacterium luticocti]
MDTQRIIVLGGGYTGIVAAGRLARQVRADEASVTLITAHPTRDERMRWHELAAGGRYPLLSIADALAGSPVALEIGRVERIDLDGHAVQLADGRSEHYDRLVVALGSVIDFGAVPGAREHAHGLTDVESVRAAAATLGALPDGAPVTVIGGGLTGIELATEIAESHPRLAVTIVGSREPGHWLSDPARRYLARAFERLGIAHRVGRVARITGDAVVLADGAQVPSALTFWAGGFRANPIVAASGLEADELGRAHVDATFRSLSHPDVWVIGDAARVPGPDGVPLKMGCRTGAFMAFAAPHTIAQQLSGAPAEPFAGRYFAECISLGRGDALLQWLTADGAPTDRILTGRAARVVKEYIHRGNLFVARHPGPYGPHRRAHVRTGGRRQTIGA